jgi:hypothetical protein
MQCTPGPSDPPPVPSQPSARPGFPLGCRAQHGSTCAIITVWAASTQGTSSMKLRRRKRVVSGQWSAGIERRMAPRMSLHRPVANAGSSGPVDSAGSPACRGRRPGKVEADRTAEDVESRKTDPTQTRLDCHKPFCGIALNSFRASVASKNEANDRGCFLYTAECRYRDGPEGSRGESGSQARQQANANQRKHSRRTTTQLPSHSSPTMTHVIRGEKSPRRSNPILSPTPNGLRNETIKN